LALSSTDCNFIRTLVRRRSGIVLEEEKVYLVETRLTALARREGLTSAEALLAKFRMQSSNGLQDKIVEALTTNETSFFRDLQPFEALRQVVLPELLKRREQQRRLFIWCAASSSGQEPYSLAMLLHDHFPALTSWNVRILATDLSLEMLERARRGVYSHFEVNRGLPAPLLVKFFERQGLEWRLKDSLRRMVEFRQLNLVEPWPSMFAPDIIMMRNVLIYFDVETKKVILGKARRLLPPDGYLFLGGAETPMNLDDSFERISFDRSGCYRLRR
jgi:chemotaxis protein methyltransferase CheR